MLPAYRPGDHVLTFNWVKPKAGDVVVFSTKGGSFSRGKNYIKRIGKIEGNDFFVFGDNKKESSKIEPVKREQIVGKVILKY